MDAKKMMLLGLLAVALVVVIIAIVYIWRKMSARKPKLSWADFKVAVKAKHAAHFVSAGKVTIAGAETEAMWFVLVNKKVFGVDSVRSVVLNPEGKDVGNIADLLKSNSRTPFWSSTQKDRVMIARSAYEANTAVDFHRYL
jgi:uncharacterized protein (UPF0333 family)